MYAILYIYSFGPLEEFESVCFLYKVRSFGCPKYPGMSFQPLHTRSWLSQPSAKPPKKTDSSPSKRRSVVCSLQFPFYGSTLHKKHALLGRSKIEKSRRNPHRGRPTSGEIMWNPNVCWFGPWWKSLGRSPPVNPPWLKALFFSQMATWQPSFFRSPKKWMSSLLSIPYAHRPLLALLVSRLLLKAPSLLLEATCLLVESHCFRYRFFNMLEWLNSTVPTSYSLVI